MSDEFWTAVLWIMFLLAGIEFMHFGLPWIVNQVGLWLTNG